MEDKMSDMESCGAVQPGPNDAFDTSEPKRTYEPPRVYESPRIVSGEVFMSLIPCSAPGATPVAGFNPACCTP